MARAKSRDRKSDRSAADRLAVEGDGAAAGGGAAASDGATDGDGGAEGRGAADGNGDGAARGGAVGSRRGIRSPMRLDAYLSRSGLVSRREARALVRQGRVRVEGLVCREPERRICGERVELDQTGIASPDAAVRDYLLHKPVGLACSRDERESPLVYDLLEPALRRRPLHIAGRLDRATSGLLILTSDGDLVHRLTHPTRKLPKRYRVGYRGELPEDATLRCRAGLLLEGEEKPTRPAELVLDGPGRATLVLREGRTHQVRRMFRALGAFVEALHRDRIGGLDLPPDLEPGGLRPLTDAERALLTSESSL